MKERAAKETKGRKIVTRTVRKTRRASAEENASSLPTADPQICCDAKKKKKFPRCIEAAAAALLGLQRKRCCKQMQDDFKDRHPRR